MCAGRVEVEWCGWAGSGTAQGTAQGAGLERVVTWGSSELSLYQVENLPADEPLKPGWLRLSPERGAHLLACSCELSYIRAISVHPLSASSLSSEDVLLAVGQANGHVTLMFLGPQSQATQPQPHPPRLLPPVPTSTITSASTPSITLTATASPSHLPTISLPLELSPRHGRQVQAVSWNPWETSLLAVALDRYRADHGAIIWDINAFGAGPGPGPLAELAISESVHSVAWLPRHPRVLILGANHKHLKIYDLREGAKPKSSTQTKAVWGLSLDPLAPHRLASFSDTTVSLWDLRNLDKAAYLVTQPAPVSRLSWCPTRAGLLGMVLHGGASGGGLRLLDVQQGLGAGTVEGGGAGVGGGGGGGGGTSGGGTGGTSGTGVDDVEPAVLERWLPLGAANGPLASFAWHPTRQNTLIASHFAGAPGGPQSGSVPGTVGPSLTEHVVCERVAVACAPSASQILCSGPAPTLVLAFTPRPSVGMVDTAHLMRLRALSGYGLDLDVMHNGEVQGAKEDPSLRRLWHWMDSCKQRTSCGESRLCRFPGIKAVLKVDGGVMVGGPSDAVQVPWVGLQDGETQLVNSGRRVPSAVVFRSEERNRALQLCGWGVDSRLLVQHQQPAAASRAHWGGSGMWGGGEEEEVEAAAEEDSSSTTGTAIQDESPCVTPVTNNSPAVRGWLTQFLVRLEEEGQFTRAAAVAAFHLQLRRAIQCLQRGAIEQASSSSSPSSPSGTTTSPSTGSHLAVLAMSLAGFCEERNSLWHEMCQRTGSQLQDPYLRALFAFLTAEPAEHYDRILLEEGMSVADRVAFACLFLGDTRLAEFVERLQTRLLDEGRLEGLLLTGIGGREGAELLQRYVDVTGDVQTAATLLLHSQALAAQYGHDPRLQTWADAYCILLDAWQLWNQRALFDVALHASLGAAAAAVTTATSAAGTPHRVSGASAGPPSSPLFLSPSVLGGGSGGGGGSSSSSSSSSSVAGFGMGGVGSSPPAPPQQVFVSCNFCGKSISAMVQGMGRRGVGIGGSLARLASSGGGGGGGGGGAGQSGGGGGGGGGGHHRLKMSSCPNCRKPLPRCYICLMHMGTASGGRPASLPANAGGGGQGVSAFTSWFSWCQSCHHGGHADHIANWFRDHGECPVTGCSCHCLAIDAVNRLSMSPMSTTTVGTAIAAGAR